MQRQILISSVALLFTGAMVSQAATFEEKNGQVTIEAEHFDSRTVQSGGAHHYAIIPDEDPGTGGTFKNARGGKYMQNLPDSGESKNTDASVVGIPPYLDYKVKISTTGEYQLYLRDMGIDGGSDSIYAQIVEITSPQWYRYGPVPNSGLDFNLLQNDPNDNTTVTGWNGYAAPEVNSGNGGELPAVWTIPTAGTYTIRLSQREDGNALDALILQLSSMNPPTSPGPAESTPTGAFVIIDQNLSNVTWTSGQPLTLSVAAHGSGALSYQWQKAPAGSTNFTDIAGATTTNLTTAALTAADSLSQYRVVVSTSGASATSKTSVVTVDAASPTIASLSGSSSLDAATVTFSEPVTAATAGNAANYSLSGGLSVLGASVLSPTTVKLTTSKQTQGASYTLTVNNVRDVAGGGGNVIAASSTQNFTAVTLTLVSARTFGGSNLVTVFFNQPVTGTAITNLMSDDFSGASLDTTKWQPDNKPFEVGATTNFSVTQANGTVTFKVTATDQYWPGAALQTVQKFSASPSAPLIFQVDRVSHQGTGTATRTGVWISDATRDNYVLFAENVGEGNWQFNRKIGEDGDNPTGTGVVMPLVNAAGFKNGGNHRVKLVADGQNVKFYLDDEFGAMVPFPITDGITFEIGVYARAIGDTVTGVFDNALVSKGAAPPALNFTIDNGVTVSGVALTSDPSALELTTSALASGKTNTLSVSGVQGVGGNVIAANSKIAIDLTPANQAYAAAVLADKPLAFYELSALSGTNAPNAGSSGTAGDGLYVPGPAVGGPGPRPATGQAGFDQDNVAAIFDGVTNYVATSQQFLDSVGTFTIELWAKPVDITASRIGLAGQNDAIEFGFITPATVEVYTGGGGSLDVGYPFPSGEWHYIAVVGDGTNLFMYFDGAQAGKGGSAVSGSYGSSSYMVNIGGGGIFDATGNFFSGGLDEVAIYDTALSADRIKAHYDIGAGTLFKPTVTLSSPAQGATFPAGANVTLTATAGATGSKTISKVEFFAGTNKVGEATSSPFSVTLPNVSSGRYSYTAKATDSGGLTQTSSAVSIVVGTPPPLVLFVTADAGPLTFAGDQAVYQHLINSGFDVQISTGSAVPDDGSSANGAALIIISSSLSSGTVVAGASKIAPSGDAKFINTPVPLMEWESALQDNFDFQDDASPKGSTDGQTDVNIVDASSPLAAGLSAGPHTVVSAPQLFSWGTPVGAHVVATLASDTTEACIYYYDKGEKTLHNLAEPARRVFFFFENNTASAANDTGWKLFDAAVTWLTAGSQGGGPQPEISFSRSGNSLTISWTNNGTLQSTTSLSSPIQWKDESSNSPFTTTMTQSAEFFRVRK